MRVYQGLSKVLGFIVGMHLVFGVVGFRGLGLKALRFEGCKVQRFSGSRLQGSHGFPYCPILNPPPLLQVPPRIQAI